MAKRERINPKTGKKEYKARYYYYVDGKKKDADTSWFTSKEKAEAEAKRLKEEKEKAERHKVLQRRDKMLLTAFEEFVEYCEEQYKVYETNTNKKNKDMANSILHKHIPAKVGSTKIKDVDMMTFKTWINAINDKENISGSYMRLCKGTITKFNDWLNKENFYLDDYLYEQIRYGISNTTIKSSKVGNKEEEGKRNIVTILDVLAIGEYYKKQGLGKFRNFYYYTLFYVLFFSGVRPEELVGLQWKFIDLRKSERTISIKNAISVVERREHALERTRKGQYKTKNKTSIRTIPIFDFYYQLLIDYKESYKYQYGLTDKEVEEGFVFPNLSAKDHTEYVHCKNLWDELDKLEEELKLKPTDLQMFRHSCATFLILSPNEGLGYSEEKVKDYFGHQDTTMLTKIYTRLDRIQKAERMRKTFSDIYTPNEKSEKTKEEEMKDDIIARIKGNNKEMSKARKERVFAQIDECIKMGKKKYYYYSKDKKIVDEYIKINGESIEFVEEE